MIPIYLKTTITEFMREYEKNENYRKSEKVTRAIQIEQGKKTANAYQGLVNAMKNIE
jgi:hypothetical protein